MSMGGEVGPFGILVNGRRAVGHFVRHRYPAWAACFGVVWAVPAAAAPGTRSGPERNSVPQITAPTLKMAAATQNPVV